MTECRWYFGILDIGEWDGLVCSRYGCTRWLGGNIGQNLLAWYSRYGRTPWSYVQNVPEHHDLLLRIRLGNQDAADFLSKSRDCISVPGIYSTAVRTHQIFLECPDLQTLYVVVPNCTSTILTLEFSRKSKSHHSPKCSQLNQYGRYFPSTDEYLLRGLKVG